MADVKEVWDHVLLFFCMYKIFDINIAEMLSVDMVEPSPDHSPILLAIVPLDDRQVRPMVLYWNERDGNWIDEQGHARTFILWVYISVTQKEHEDGNTRK